MSHAFIWSEINSSTPSLETYREVSSVGFGTNVSGTWNKKLFRLKWINSSVEDVKIWIENEFADIYTDQHYPQIKNTSGVKLLQDLGFDLRFTIFDSFTVTDLPNADVATTTNLSSASLAGISRLATNKYVDGLQMNNNRIVLVKNQTDATQNGLYKVLSSSGYGTITVNNAEDILTAGRIVAVGSSSWVTYSQYLSPFETAAYGTTSVLFVSRNNIYQLTDVQAATTTNLGSSATGLSSLTATIDNRTIALNDRILVKDQTNKVQNGIYYVTSLYKANGSTIYNPYTSTVSADDFWDDAVSYINANNYVNVQVLTAGVAYSGAYFRFYSGSGLTGGTASTSVLKWSNATYNYSNTNVDYYYEVSSGSTSVFRNSLGLLTQTTSIVSTGNGNTAALNVGNTLLVKHHNNAASGIYSVTSVGSSNLWTRSTSYNQSNEIAQTIVKVANYTNTIGGNIFYLGKSTTHSNSFSINYDGITIQERFYPYTYQPVSNLITTNISDFAKVNSNIFADPGIGVSQRVLVTGQTIYPSQNGIYSVAALCETIKGLEFSSTYSVERGALITVSSGSAGAGTSYFLYAIGSNTAAGSIGVTFVNITSAPTVICKASTGNSTGSYVMPGDFDVPVSIGMTVLVNSSNQLNNGIYAVSSIGNSTKRVFDFADGLVNWSKDILTNVLTTNTDGTYYVSPNLKKQLSGVYQASSIASTHYGEIFVPEISFPSTATYENFFGVDGKSSSFIQELDIDWKEQDFQKYNVRAVFYSATDAGFPTTAGTAISSLVRSRTGSGTSTLQANESILVFIGSGVASTHVKNGIYRPVYTNIGSVYFAPHEDFYFNTRFASNTDYKTLASPYERPTQVNINYGYVAAGSTFSYDRTYMQAEVGVRAGLTGTSYISSDLETVLNAGTETYTADSEVRLSSDFLNLSRFPKIAPIQHVLEANTTLDTVSGDIVVVKRNGTQLYSTVTGDLNNYYYTLGDRVYYYSSTEDLYNSSVRKSTSGVYQIVHVDNNFNYYLRKVKYNSVNGYLDFAKRLVGYSATGSTIYLARPETPTTNFTWDKNQYPDALADVYVVSTGGTIISRALNTDFTIDAKNGLLSVSGSGWTGTLYMYLYSDTSVPKYNEDAKQLFNRYYYTPQSLVYRNNLFTTTAKLSANLVEDGAYFQVVNSAGTSTTTEKKFNRDRSSWIKSYSVNKNYSSFIHNIFESSSNTEYFFTQRLSTDGYYVKSGSGNTSLFTDVAADPVTRNTLGLYTGSLYLQKIFNSGTAATLDSTWYSGIAFSTNSNVLVLTNKPTTSYSDKFIDSGYQSSYYSDKNSLVVHDKTGKRDQKIYKFVRSEYATVGLAGTSVFAGNNFSAVYASVQNSAGYGTFCLYFDPASVTKSTSSRSWIDISTRTIYNASAGSTGNISDPGDISYEGVLTPFTFIPESSGIANTAIIDGYTVQFGDQILLKNQSDTTKNGIYTAVQNYTWTIERAPDLNATNELYELGRVLYDGRTFELNLPEDSSAYNLGSSAINTPLFWKQLGAEYTIDVVGVSTSNYSGFTSISDTINGIGVSDGDKVLFLGQTSEAERYVARVKQISQPNLIRVGTGSSTTQFSIASLYVKDANTNSFYETYFNPSSTTVGSHNVEFFKQNYLSNYTACSFASTQNQSLGLTVNISNVQIGDRILLKDQSDNKQNGIYFVDESAIFYLTRHSDLISDDQISLTKKVNVLGGNTSSGYYGLVYDETIASPGIGVTPIYFAKVNSSPFLSDVVAASTANIVLTNPPSTLDGVILEKFDRILLKNQGDKTQNGVYYVASIGSSNVWSRTTDLDTSVEIKPQITVRISGGDTYSEENFRIKLPLPATLSNTVLTEYTLGTTNIDWVSTTTEAYDSSPDTWQSLKAGYSNAINIGNAKLGIEQTSRSKIFGIAVKTPSPTLLATNNITTNGQVRNLRFKVEYKTVKD
jgi:hypothetical protein